MSEAHEQRTPVEEAAKLAQSQTAQQVDTWMSQNAERVEKAWERSAEGRQSWREAQRQQWPGAKAYEATIDGYLALRTQWRADVRDPAVQEALRREAVQAGVVTPTVAERSTREVEQSRLSEAAHSHTKPHDSLGHDAGEEAYQQHIREAHSQTPAGREERDVAPAAVRSQQERSQDMAARGWGQSWEEQQQERGLHQ